MGQQVTFCWPTNLIGQSFSSAILPGAARGIAPLVANSNNQVTVDTSIWPMQIMLDSGFTIAPPVGSTVNRPTAGLYPGMFYLDTTLGTPIWRNSANSAWINSAGSTV